MRQPDRARATLFGEGVRFLLAGGLNTAATLVLYWLLLPLGYRTAYSLSFVAGIALAYQLQGRFVFKARPSVRSAATFPLIYVVQYLVGLLVLWFWHARLGLPERYGVLASIAVTLPLTFVLSRFLFRTHARPSRRP